jgi:GAF domain-containing protein
MTTNSTSLSALQDVLDAHGLQAGLLLLNRRVPHRFTSVYRLSDQRLRRIGFVDKQGGEGPDLADLPFKDSFCEISVREGQFVTTEAGMDDRLDGNPYQALVGSYVGMPLAERPGALFGTFCHYDLCGHPIDEGELAFLEQASQLLTRFCLRPGMPLHSPVAA